MKSRDLDTSKELAAAKEEEEAVMENKKIRKDTELQICSKECADGAVKEDEGAGMERKKFCTDCRTTKTPLWRVGPSGPKSLCNACGIRYRKKTQLASNSGSQSHQETEKEKKMSLVILGNDWFLETTSEGKKQRRLRKRKLREEEIAAASLVALSCGSVFA